MLPRRPSHVSTRTAGYVDDLRRRWPVFRFVLPGGVDVAIVEYPAIETDAADRWRHRPVPGRIEGEVYGFRRDGFPVLFRYSRAEGVDPTPDFLVQAMRSADCRDVGIRLAEGLVFFDGDCPSVVDTPRRLLGLLADEVVGDGGREHSDAAAIHYLETSAEIGFADRLETPILSEHLDADAFTALQWHRVHAHDWLRAQIAEAGLLGPLLATAASDPGWPMAGGRRTAENLAATLCARAQSGRRVAADDVALAGRLVGLGAEFIDAAPDVRVGAGGEPSGLEHAFRMLRRLPRDWWPEDALGWRAVVRVASAAVLMERITGIEVRQLVGPCRGRWEAYCRRLARLCPGWETRLDASGDIAVIDLRGVRDGVGDLVSAFAAQVYLPLAARSSDGRVCEGRTSADMLRSAVERNRGRISRLLFGEASAAGILETALKWHRGLAVMEAEIGRTSPETSAARCWPAGVPEWRTTAKSGRTFRIVPLTSQRMLADEGGAGRDADGMEGLGHCVGTFEYVSRCMAGRARIVSVRETGPDGSERRVSTAEFRVRRPGEFMLVQHHGRGNAVPDDEVCEAVYAYNRMLGGVRCRPPAYVASDFDAVEEPAEVSAVCGYDWRDDAAFARVRGVWEPLLRRPLRGVPERVLAAEAGLADRVEANVAAPAP